MHYLFIIHRGDFFTSGFVYEREINGLVVNYTLVVPNQVALNTIDSAGLSTGNVD